MARAQQWNTGSTIGAAPSAPSQATVVTADAAATVSFLAPAQPRV